MDGRTRVVVGTGEPVMSLGLQAAVGLHADLDPVGAGAHVGALLELAARHENAVAIIDTTILGAMPVVSVRALAGAGLRPLLLLDPPSLELLPPLLRAGARGCVPRTADVGVLIAAVRAVGGGRLALSDALQREVTALLLDLHDDAPRLSTRERHVLGLVGDGLSSVQIATTLHVSERTVKSHITSAGSKLGTKGRAATAMRALRLGLLA